MRSHTTATAASDGTRARLPGRTRLLLLGVTLTGLAGAYLLSPVAPIIPADPTVGMAPSPGLRMPMSPPSEPVRVRVDRLMQRDSVESARTRSSAPHSDPTSGAHRSEVGVRQK